MQKARSRLTVEPIKPQTGDRKYFRTAPLGILGLCMGGGLVFLVLRIPPEEIAHFPLPNSYGPFLITLFFAIYFLVGYILQSLRWGLLIALPITILFLLRFQHVVF